jgi:hypothetical protein
MVVSDYDTKFLDKAGTKHLIDELKEYINRIDKGDTDLSAYAKKSDIPTVPSLEEYVTGAELENRGYLTEHQSLDGYATTEYVAAAIQNVEISDTDLGNYYTKDETYNKEEINTLIPTITDGGSSVGGGTGITYAYEAEIETQDRWFDGRRIYLRIFHIDALPSSSTVYFTAEHKQTSFADKIIAVDTRWEKDGNVYSGNGVSITSVVSGSSASNVATSINNVISGKTLCCYVQNQDGNFNIFVIRGTGMKGYECDVFVRYVKAE